jgi:hypothetical protein
MAHGVVIYFGKSGLVTVHDISAFWEGIDGQKCLFAPSSLNGAASRWGMARL